MIIELVRTPSGLSPITDESVKAVSKIKMGYSVFVEYRPKRNYRNHKRFFSMLQGVVHNSDYYQNVDNLLSMLKLKTGHFEIVISHKGEQLYIPKSIDFASMSEDLFQEFFSECIDVILEFTDQEDIDSILKYI